MILRLTKEQVEMAQKNGVLEQIRSQEIAYCIGQKYTIDDQIAILRQRYDKPAEEAKFYEYAEECKKFVDAHIKMLGGIL